MEQDDPLGREGGDHSRVKSAGKASPGIDREAIKREYIYGDKSLNRIADEYGSSDGTIRYHAKKGGWVRLVGTKRLKPGPAARLPGAPRPTAEELRRRRLAQRLFKVIDAKLQEIETRMTQADADAAPPSAADTERDVRSVNSLMGLFDKVVELDEAARKAGKGSETNTVRSEADADRVRRDLAERLGRINPASAPERS